MIWLHGVHRRGAHGKNFKNLITVYNFNAQQAKVSGVFYYFEAKFFFGGAAFFFPFFLFFLIATPHTRACEWQLEGEAVVSELSQQEK